MKIDFKARLSNKAWWIGIISLIVLLLQQIGLASIADYIPANYADIINTVFALLAMLGVTVDTSTDGLSDNK